MVIFFMIVIAYMILDNKMINDDIKESSKIKWTKKDAEEYYNKNYKQECEHPIRRREGYRVGVYKCWECGKIIFE